MRILVKLSSSLVTSSKSIYKKQYKSDRKRNIAKVFLEVHFISSFFTSAAKFSEFDARNMILFQVKVLGKNIKEIR